MRILDFPFVIGLAIAQPLLYPRTASRLERDLIGLLGGDNGLLTPPATTAPAGLAPLPTPTLGFGQPRSTSISHIETTTSRNGVPTTTNPGAVGSAPIASGLLLTLPSPNPNAESVASGTTTTESNTGYTGSGANTPPAELTEWKVIGIGVICVTLMAIVVLSISFFDSWWGFLRAVICGDRGKRGTGEEMMVPDWNTRSWEFRLASEEGHRYPTIASLESIVKEKELHDFGAMESSYHAPKIASPELAYGAK